MNQTFVPAVKPADSQIGHLDAVPLPKLSRWYYLVQVVFVLLALGVYVAIYFLNTLSPQVVSYYYSNDYRVMSTYLTGASAVPQPEFTVATLVKTIAFNWIMWKAANILVILDMLQPFTWHRKLIGVGTFSIVMLALDWVIFILLNRYSYDFAFVGVSWLFSFLITIALFFHQQQQPFLTTIRNSFVPYFSYSLLIVFYWLAMPQLFKVLTANMSGIYGTLTFFYIFPVVDTILVLFNWLMQSMVSQRMKLFVSTTTNWLLQGYRVGIICRLSYSQADLYYQIGWIMFRNVLFNWVINKSKSNQLNLSMPGWIIAYYISEFLNFLPVCGINNLIVSTYYTSYMYMARPYLLPSNLYNPMVTSVKTYNTSLNGNVLWYVPLMIWAVETFTQKYHLYEFNWKLVIYNLFGIYLFYVGLISGLGIYYLQAYTIW